MGCDSRVVRDLVPGNIPVGDKGEVGIVDGGVISAQST